MALRAEWCVMKGEGERLFVLTLFIFKEPNYVLTRTLTERVV